LRRAHEGGAMTIAMTNVVDSVMAREADGVIYTHAGPEIGVAGTKCTMAQIALLEAFALHLARLKEVGSSHDRAAEARALLGAPRIIADVLGRIARYEETALGFRDVENVFFLG